MFAHKVLSAPKSRKRSTGHVLEVRRDRGQVPQYNATRLDVPVPRASPPPPNAVRWLIPSGTSDNSILLRRVCSVRGAQRGLPPGSRQALRHRQDRYVWPQARNPRRNRVFWSFLPLMTPFVCVVSRLCKGCQQTESRGCGLVVNGSGAAQRHRGPVPRATASTGCRQRCGGSRMGCRCAAL